MNRKSAWVIGGSGGIGSAIADRLSQDGFSVFATYYQNKNSENLGHIRWQQVDVVDRESVKSATEGILKESELLDVIVYCPTRPVKATPLIDTKWSDIESHWNTQVRGLCNVVQSVKDQLQQEKPIKFIVLITEYCYGNPPNGLAAYVSAKYALLGLCKSLAIELAASGSTVNTISPGLIQTPLTSHLPDRYVEMIADTNPLKRIGTPKDVANVAAFLASSHANYLNGENIFVNGGNKM